MCLRVPAKGLGVHGHRDVLVIAGDRRPGEAILTSQDETEAASDA